MARMLGVWVDCKSAAGKLRGWVLVQMHHGVIGTSMVACGLPVQRGVAEMRKSLGNVVWTCWWRFVALPRRLKVGARRLGSY